MKRRKKSEFYLGIKKGMEEAIAWSNGKAVSLTIRTVSLRPKRKSVGKRAHT